MSLWTASMAAGLPLAKQVVSSGEVTALAVSDSSDQSLSLCPHCEMLGVSAAIRPDKDSPDFLHCSLCQVTFQFTTEGSKLNVTQVIPYAGEA